MIEKIINRYQTSREFQQKMYINYDSINNELCIKGINTLEVLFDTTHIRKLIIRDYTSYYEAEIHFSYDALLLNAKSKFTFTSENIIELFLTFNEIWFDNSNQIEYLPCFFNLQKHTSKHT